MKQRIMGLDLGEKYAQVSVYNERSKDPESVALLENQEEYAIPVPADLFSLIEGSVELGLMTLANFIKTCVSYVRPAVEVKDLCMMITMDQMVAPWPDALRGACEMAGMDPRNVFLQTHRESFCYYTLNQKRELWNHTVALFEYEADEIRTYMMNVDYATRPAIAEVKKGEVLPLKKPQTMEKDQWNTYRDQKFLEMVKGQFGNHTISSVYLVGDDFNKSWTVESVRYLCWKRHVFQGQNLYTKGACYGALDRLGIGKKLDQFLYRSEDMVETNLTMQMDIRGKNTTYRLINAGINWFEAEHTCEFIVENTREIVIYGKSVFGEDLMSYTVDLKDLPVRPDRTTRLFMKLKFIAAGRCKVTVRDMGFGEFYPPSGQVWESILEV